MDMLDGPRMNKRRNPSVSLLAYLGNSICCVLSETLSPLGSALRLCSPDGEHAKLLELWNQEWGRNQDGKAQEVPEVHVEAEPVSASAGHVPYRGGTDRGRPLS